jgi:mevalonate kinase
MTVAYACGKVILFGEHAVVYGQPAIAVPVTQVLARAVVEDADPGGGVTIAARDLDQVFRLGEPAERDRISPLVVTARNTLECIGTDAAPDLAIEITSSIPVASGMGSGAAVATALVRALSRHLGAELSPDEVSALVYRTEVLHHGTPSGIDNSVIAFERPTYFVKDESLETFEVGHPFLLIIADTGVPSATRDVVDFVRRAWQVDRPRFDGLFSQVGLLAVQARNVIARGHPSELGSLMDTNQELLEEIGVSSPEIDRLVAAARGAGALGAKLSGAGWGGNIVALVTPSVQEEVVSALQIAGAVRTITTEVV